MRSTNSVCYVRARSAGSYGKHDSRRVNLAIRERSRKDHWN
jgi:hypothetical protein